jgi:hypothetical protein
MWDGGPDKAIRGKGSFLALALRKIYYSLRHDKIFLVKTQRLSNNDCEFALCADSFDAFLA